MFDKIGSFFGAKKTPEIIVQCKKLKNMYQLQNLGSFISLGTEISSDDLKEALSKSTLDSLEIYQIIMLIFLIPPTLSPKELYDAFQLVFPRFEQLPSRMQTGLAMKWIRTAILSDHQKELYDSNVIHNLYKNNPDLYTAPYLYLCSSTDHPESVEVNFSGDVRINAEALYFSAINKMLLSDYNNAEIDLIRALTLSKKCSDMKDAILAKLSLCSFLNRTPESVFRRRVPIGRNLPKIAEDIWNFDRPLDITFLPPFYKRFTDEITYEHARGVILNLASTVTVMKLEDVKKMLGNFDVDALVSVLESENTLKATIEGEYIYFDDTSKSDLLNTKIQEVQQLIQSLS